MRVIVRHPCLRREHLNCFLGQNALAAYHLLLFAVALFTATEPAMNSSVSSHMTLSCLLGVFPEFEYRTLRLHQGDAFIS